MEGFTVSPWTVFLYALFTAAATGLGTLPFLFTQNVLKRHLGLANAAAAGLMVAASFGLIYEGVNYSLGRTLLGVALGLLFIRLSHRYLENREVSFGELKGLDARKALMIVGIMTLHSFAEGVGVGVAFGGGEALGVFITLAIAVHNIPEGLAISLVLVPRGVNVLGAAFWSVFSSLPQPLMAVPAFLLVEAFRPLLPVGLGFAAGAMIWMAVAELLPDALKEAEAEGVATVLTVAAALMVAFQILLGG
ncbi:dihydroorotate dehydrogenase [Thermus sp. 2.9]|uniref:ZIP family metal transporter n=1 Tax=Thermus TaxID=270 RepID=UPI0005421E85|nr:MULTISPECIES: ZIP family metal transporter [Thermus]KHG66559.1 dihydroorotate dehydrogenase [Thermus sp. 2.9]